MDWMWFAYTIAKIVVFLVIVWAIIGVIKNWLFPDEL